MTRSARQPAPARTNGRSASRAPTLSSSAIASRHALLVLEWRREALLGATGHPWPHGDLRISVLNGPRRNREIYEDCCLATLMTQEGQRRLQVPRPSAGSQTRPHRDERPGYGAAPWAEPWGGILLTTYHADLARLAGDRMKLARWLGPRAKGEAERRAQRRFERLMLELELEEKRADATARYGPFAGRRHLQRNGGSQLLAEPGEVPAANGESAIPARLPRRPKATAAQPARRRGAVIAAVGAASIAVLALVVGSVASDDSSPAVAAIPLAPGIASGLDPEPFIAEARAERRARERARERAEARELAAERRERRRAAAAEAQAAEAAAADEAAAAEETAAAEAEPTTPEATAPAPAPAPAPPAPAAPEPAAPEPAAPPSGGGGSDCFTFEC
jgi:hypothetical protein